MSPTESFFGVIYWTEIDSKAKSNLERNDFHCQTLQSATESFLGFLEGRKWRRVENLIEWRSFWRKMSKMIMKLSVWFVEHFSLCLICAEVFKWEINGNSINTHTSQRISERYSTHASNFTIITNKLMQNCRELRSNNNKTKDPQLKTKLHS